MVRTFFKALQPLTYVRYDNIAEGIEGLRGGLEDIALVQPTKAEAHVRLCCPSCDVRARQSLVGVGGLI